METVGASTYLFTLLSIQLRLGKQQNALCVCVFTWIYAYININIYVYIFLLYSQIYLLTVVSLS